VVTGRQKADLNKFPVGQEVPKKQRLYTPYGSFPPNFKKD
jgi:hypothetical protein